MNQVISRNFADVSGYNHVMKKTLIVTFGAIVLIASAVTAQDNRRDFANGRGGRNFAGGPRGFDPVERMSRELNLTEDQKTRMRAAMDEQRKQRESLQADTTLSRQEKMSRMREMGETSRAKMDEILTTEQKAKQKELMEQRRQRMQDHQRKGPPSQRSGS